MIEVKKLPAKRWKDCRDLRLDALKKDAAAFGSAYEEEKNFSESEWKRRAKNTLFALSDNFPVGMIVYVFNDKIKIRHIANIYGFYVKQSYRNLGAGKRLIETALSFIMKNKNIIKISLNVNPRQKSAVRLYKKFSFKVVGVMKKDLFVNGKFYDELILEKFI